MPATPEWERTWGDPVWRAENATSIVLRVIGLVLVIGLLVVGLYDPKPDYSQPTPDPAAYVEEKFYTCDDYSWMGKQSAHGFLDDEEELALAKMTPRCQAQRRQWTK